LPVVQIPIDHSELFARSQKTRELRYINDIAITTKSDKDDLLGKLITRIGDTELASYPTCQCGNIVGHVHVQMGTICPLCGTQPTIITSDEKTTKLWFRTPDTSWPIFNPIYLAMLSKAVKKTYFDPVAWLIDSHYRPTSAQAEIVIQQLKDAGIKHRNYNYFCENFRFIIEVLFKNKILVSKLANEKLRTYEFLCDQISLDGTPAPGMFYEVYPISTRALIVLEVTAVGSYHDTSTLEILDAFIGMAGIDVVGLLPVTPQQKRHRLGKFVLTLRDYVVVPLLYDRIRPKEGIVRQLLFGTRTHFSARAVITSLTDASFDIDEIKLPWGAGLVMLEHHITSKLTKRGWRYNDIISHINAHAFKYCPIIDSIFKELIEECPQKGIPILFVRNPSLKQGSIILFYVKEIKIDPLDRTFGYPLTATAACNADFHH